MSDSTFEGLEVPVYGTERITPTADAIIDVVAALQGAFVDAGISSDILGFEAGKGVKLISGAAGMSIDITAVVFKAALASPESRAQVLETEFAHLSLGGTAAAIGAEAGNYAAEFLPIPKGTPAYAVAKFGFIAAGSFAGAAGYNAYLKPHIEGLYSDGFLEEVNVDFDAVKQAIEENYTPRQIEELRGHTP
ncbi:hypothetical protein [Nisaea sp.]|uniref:hypothetical protein n=1 Tax=Nisaea sp. TaxID=2024842 RepID=UPI0032EFB798